MATKTRKIYDHPSIPPKEVLLGVSAHEALIRAGAMLPFGIFGFLGGLISWNAVTTVGTLLTGAFSAVLLISVLFFIYFMADYLIRVREEMRLLYTTSRGYAWRYPKLDYRHPRSLELLSKAGDSRPNDDPWPKPDFGETEA